MARALFGRILLFGMLAHFFATAASAETIAEIAAIQGQALQLQKAGKYAEAVPLAERALAACERQFGPDHRITQLSINNLAALYQNQGRYTEAERLFQRALETNERILGKDNPQTLTLANNLAHLYHSQGRFPEAEQIFVRTLEARERVLGKDHADTLGSANNLAVVYENMARYEEAEKLYLRIQDVSERKLGKQHPQTLNSVSNLASLYSSQGRFDDAAKLYLRVLESRELVLGNEHPDTLLSVNNLAATYENLGRYAEGEQLYRRALETSERTLGKEHPQTFSILGNLASLYDSQGRYTEAERLNLSVLESKERVLGKDHPDTLMALNNIGYQYNTQGRYAEGERFLRRAVEGSERVLGRDHPQALSSTNNLAYLYSTTGRYDEAEQLYRRVIEVRERVLGKEHPDTLTSLNNLAGTYGVQGQYDEAEQLYRHVLTVAERLHGPEHPSTLVSVNNLAWLLSARGRRAEAEPLYQRALEARERLLGKEHPSTLDSLGNLAGLYANMNRHDEAEPLHRRALESRERVLGPEHPDTLTSVHDLGNLHRAKGRYAEAEQFTRRALEGRVRVFGPEHPDTLSAFNSMAAVYFVQHDWGRAAEYWRHSTAAISGRVQRGAVLTVRAKKTTEVEQRGAHFWRLVKSLYRLSPENSAPEPALLREAFQMAQWTLSSEAAQSLAQMAARSAPGDSNLGVLVRERQDLLLDWQKREKIRIVALGKELSRRNPAAEAENARRLAAIEAQIGEIDKRLNTEFPDYALLASPLPLTVEEVQAQLRRDEAMVLFLDTKDWSGTPEETFVWVVTKTDVRWVRSDMGTKSLTTEVQAVRCGLDAAAWTGPTCGKLLGADFTAEDAAKGKLLPFDHARAHALYKALFGKVEDIIKDKHLLIVPSGPLTQLPFHVLVTTPPASGDNKSASWLTRHNAITILPAVPSLKALRRVARPSTAPKPMIGFGNPLLDGPNEQYALLAQRARENQQCRPTVLQRMASLFGVRGVTPVQMRGGLAQVSHIKMQAPLPETADELCTVARNIKAATSDMLLGERATEREVKRLSNTGELARFRIVHFATHGAMAGDLKGTAEPGLILTPPDAATDEDDGYLSAPEIASLKLDADWVILSACNTAAGDTTGAQALSGLARAFIYAQARALLVSHWAVNSDATVKLITGAMREMADNAQLGRAEALRRSMLALIDKGAAHEAHPAYWAPFIVVGEGAR